MSTTFQLSAFLPQRRPRLLLLLALAPSLVAATRLQAAFDFEQDSPGLPPSGLASNVNQGFKSGVWLVQEESSGPSGNRVLVQTDADPANSRFPVCIANSFSGADVDLSVRFKAMSGKKDQAAGLVLRFRDPENYYVARANALENNVVFYKMVNGKRTDLKPVGAGEKAYGKSVPIPKNQWSTLRVIAKGASFEVYLNGEKLFLVRDETHTAAGQVGLWTKADSVTAFDDLAFAELKPD